MELVFLGTGTGIPLPHRGSPSLALLHSNMVILFDLGPGSLRQFSRAGLDYRNINHIFLTHFHPDHSADLVHFLFATRNPATLKNRSAFGITGPRGFRNFLGGICKAYEKWLELPQGLMLIEERDSAKREKGILGDLVILSQPVEHTPQSIAYRVEGPENRSFVYSGDTGYHEGIADFAKDVDLLILECSFPDHLETYGHLTPSSAGRIASQAGARRLVLLHFYPEILVTDIASQCRKTYRGDLILANDFLKMTV